MSCHSRDCRWESLEGRLDFTAYRGTNLLRQEAVAKTEEPSVAYNYRGGLKGFRIQPDTRVIWRDVARAWQKYEFGGGNNEDPVALRARNRVAIVETGGGSLAVFLLPTSFSLRVRSIPIWDTCGIAKTPTIPFR